MSADVWIDRAPCDSCGRSDERGAEVNITYNLSSMLREAGFCGWSSLVGMKAREAGDHLVAVLDGMTADPEKWRAMNPENGWGDYDRCLQVRLREFAEKCREAGAADRIGGWL